MTVVLAATSEGCLAFTGVREGTFECAGRSIGAMAPDFSGGCLAVVDGKEIWRRASNAEWSLVVMTSVRLESILALADKIFGATASAGLVRILASGDCERLKGFDTMVGRHEWFAQGPPLHIRSLTATADGGAIMAAVHVGGIPRSTDGGDTWAPTVPVMYDVHEVRAHPSSPNIVAAAAAVGLCLSQDGGRTWQVFAEGPEEPHALAVAVLEDEVIFSVQDGPFAERSQVWRWKTGGTGIEQVRDGLPEWMDGKIDTGHMAAANGRAAITDGAGNVWLSREGSLGWERIANHPHYTYGMLIV
jgi:hypothetical protein